MARRDFLRAGSALTLGPLAAAARARSGVACILLWQEGGLSHLDTFDMKPEAPPRIRGPFREIETAVAGAAHFRTPAPHRAPGG